VAQASKPQKPAVEGNRTQWFVGNEKVTGLSGGMLLPTAAEIDANAQKLSARLRNVGPFGLQMFPFQEEIASTDVSVVRPTQKTTLNQALQSLRITAINLERREFLIGARNVFQGDVMELRFRDEMFAAEIVAVTATQIEFLDRQRQETGVLLHGLGRQLVLEPLQPRARETRLAGKVAPMETITARKP
jgi:hypothetical protein